MKTHDSPLFRETVAVAGKYEQVPEGMVAFTPEEVREMRSYPDAAKRTIFALKKTFGNEARIDT